jgi:orotidine-5'-phosphate decarboxylase
MKKTLTPAERLIVAADFKPPVEGQWLEPGPYPGETTICHSKKDWVRRQVLALANSLKGTGVCLKIGSPLRACGDDLIGEIQWRGVRVFADLKLIDIDATLATDGVFLKVARPEFLTAVCSAGAPALRALKAELPDTEVLGVTVLTSLDQAQVRVMYACSIEEAVMRFAQIADVAGLDGVICSPKEVSKLREEFGASLSLITPDIRPKWATVPGDDQNLDRSMTPANAIKAGADRIVVGRPITMAENPYDAVMRIIDEIASATH